MKVYILIITILFVLFVSCSKDVNNDYEPVATDQNVIDEVLNINLSTVFNYSNQVIPGYIRKDNTPTNNIITDTGATLGRGLFYDKKLSTNNTVSCASCHKQEFAFSDREQFSKGVNSETQRHSMRLINSRFADKS